MPSDTDGDRVVNAKKTNFLFRTGAKETTREEVARSIVRRGGCKHITACHLCPGDLKGSQGKGGCVGWGEIVSVAKEWLEKNAPTSPESQEQGEAKQTATEMKTTREVTFISPEDFFAPDSPDYALWERHCSSSEQLYLKLLKDGHTPQAARTVLPNSTKTELIVYANLEQWKHIFSMRAENKAAEPSMRALMIPLQEEFRARGWL